ncbi:MAG: Smr/MutS family protein [Firmicutes bacterium]|nr:Smr/MutS family protein [Bacillota bacterium]
MPVALVVLPDTQVFVPLRVRSFMLVGSRIEAMSRTVEQLVEFDGVVELVQGFASCALGRRALARFRPRWAASPAQAADVRRDLEQEFALVREAMAYLRAGEETSFGGLPDPVAWLPKLAVPGAVLEPTALLDAAALLDAVTALRESFRTAAARYPYLAARAASLADFRGLARAIRRAILPNGEIPDEASPQLKRIRESLARTRATIQKTLRELLRARGVTPGGSEDYITVRNDRFVVPVRAAERRQVPGVVHGASATGQTLFVEPLEALEWNNQLVQLAEDEAAEIQRLLRELTDRLAAEREALEAATATIAEFDACLARARFARAFDGTLPEFAAGAQLRLEAARHPVLEANLRRQGRTVVPISLSLGDAETVLVISGPNTGGKTVALKTVGVAVLSALAGIPVAAARAWVPLADCVLADIGDEQSLTADLSTFSAHALNLRAMLEAATERSLVLVDEIGTGTAPEEGAALAVALLEEFRQRRCLTLATTHLDRLKAYAATTPGVVNAAMEFDTTRLQPTYRLRLGLPGTSCGIAIAERLGLPRSVLARARALLAPEAREAADLLAELHRSRDELEALKRDLAEQRAALEAERRRLQTEWVERQRRRLAELERQFAETLRHYEQQVRQLLGELQDPQLRAHLGRQASRRLSKLQATARAEADAAALAHLSEAQRELGEAAKTIAPPPPAAITPGRQVRVRGLAQPVVVRQRDDRTAEVQAGPLRLRVPLTDIVGLVDEPAPRPALTVSASREATDEINVIGETVEDAIRRVDEFLDAAALAAKPRVRIIHGHGTGALRRGLREFLAHHPHVERCTDEAPERGGAAVTVVELRS